MSEININMSNAVLRDEIAKTIWLAEYRRATDKERNITWFEVNPDERTKYLFVADAIIVILEQLTEFPF